MTQANAAQTTERPINVSTASCDEIRKLFAGSRDQQHGENVNLATSLYNILQDSKDRQIAIDDHQAKILEDLLRRVVVAEKAAEDRADIIRRQRVLIDTHAADSRRADELLENSADELDREAYLVDDYVKQFHDQYGDKTEPVPPNGGEPAQQPTADEIVEAGIGGALDAEHEGDGEQPAPILPFAPAEPSAEPAAARRLRKEDDLEIPAFLRRQAPAEDRIAAPRAMAAPIILETPAPPHSETAMGRALKENVSAAALAVRNTVGEVMERFRPAA